MVAPPAQTKTTDQRARQLLSRCFSLALTAGVLICCATTTAGLAYLAWGQEDKPVNTTALVSLPLDPVLARAATQAVNQATSQTTSKVITKAADQLATRIQADSDGAAHDPSKHPHPALSAQAPVGSFDDIKVKGTPVPIEPVPSTEPADVVVDLPVPAPTQKQASSTEDRFIVMIDPGHGGSDPGAKAPNGLLEKDITRDIAERTRLFLSEIEDMDVLMTREGDAGLSRQLRVNRIKSSGADLVVSLHFNHLPQSDITLVESFYASRENILESRALQREAGAQLPTSDNDIDLNFTAGSARLAGLIQNRVYSEVSNGNSTTIDAGVKPDTLFVLTRSFLPGALVELTCLSNPREAERLTTESYRNELSAALADAIRNYRASLKEHPLDALDV